jgi:hypothetical protein
MVVLCKYCTNNCNKQVCTFYIVRFNQREQKKTKKLNKPAAAARPTTLTVKSEGKTSSKDDSESVTPGNTLPHSFAMALK